MIEIVLSGEEVFAFNNGDQTVFNRIRDHCIHDVTYYTYAIVQHTAEAEDIVTDAFVKLWEKRDKFKSGGAIQAYLFRVVRNKALDFIRHKKVQDKYRSAKSQWIEDQEELADIAKILDTHTSLITELLDFVTTFTPNERKLFNRHFIDKVRLNVVQQELGVNKNTVTRLKKSVLAQIRKFFRSKGLMVIWLLLETFLKIF